VLEQTSVAMSSWAFLAAKAGALSGTKPLLADSALALETSIQRSGKRSRWVVL
jgi:hypothetical protein